MFRSLAVLFGSYPSQRQAEGANQNAHAGSRTRVTSMGGLYDTVTLHARDDVKEPFLLQTQKVSTLHII